MFPTDRTASRHLAWAGLREVATDANTGQLIETRMDGTNHSDGLVIGHSPGGLSEMRASTDRFPAPRKNIPSRLAID
jgi:hypothetical protein